MNEMQLVTVIFAGVNCVLALALGTVYWRNHRQMRSPFTLGLLLFAAFLLIHNSLAVYHYFTMMGMASPTEDTFRLVEALLQTGASGTLLFATLR